MFQIRLLNVYVCYWFILSAVENHRHELMFDGKMIDERNEHTSRESEDVLHLCFKPSKQGLIQDHVIYTVCFTCILFCQ